MKVKPMIFNPDMVRALMDGNKTQTRRPVKHQPFLSSVLPSWVFPRNKSEVALGESGLLYPNAKESVLALSGYSVGDLIYVRETFSETDIRPAYKADSDDGIHCIVKRWTPSIHMPRWASRLTLKVTSVRIERVQNISPNDCIAEGFRGGHGSIPGYMYSATPKEHFSETWKQIYGDHWDSNGWCWVIDFEVIHQNVDSYLKNLEAA
tara:strand:- start:444 stop:1064 length:621 start_codon:yes stop_codon:yes gene_type:complete